MPIVRSRPVFADVTNVAMVEEAGSTAADNASTQGICGRSGKRTRVQKATATIHHTATRTTLQPVPSPKNAPLLAMTAPSLASGTAPSVLAGTTLPTSVVVAPAGTLQIRQPQAGKGSRQPSTAMANAAAPAPVPALGGVTKADTVSFSHCLDCSLEWKTGDLLAGQCTQCHKPASDGHLPKSRLSAGGRDEAGATHSFCGASVRLSAGVRDEAQWTSDRTHLAVLFENMRHMPHGNPEEHVDMVLADLVDGLLQTSHRESQKHLPTSDDLIARLGSNQREQILEWLVQACDIMRLHDGVLYSTVLTLDRYCAAAHDPLPMERMQKVLMAVICTVLKTCTVSDEVCMPLRELLLHLCRRQVGFEEILAMEHRVLQTLQFSGLSAPTPLDFLDAFCTPLLAMGESIESNMPRCLANFLIQLSLFNASLHYRQPHAILAAAGVYVALCGLRVPHVVHQRLLQDVATICPEIPDVCTRVVSCASELHGLWLDFAATQGNRVLCILRKFSGARLHAALILNPPAALSSTPTASPIRSPSAATNSSSGNSKERREASQSHPTLARVVPTRTW